MNTVGIKSMKQTLLIAMLSCTPLISQIGPSATASQTPDVQIPSTPIPKYLVYGHFLLMMHDREQKSIAAGDTDLYRFAEPFSRAGLTHAELDLLREEARMLRRELQSTDDRAKTLVDDYRARATAASNGGQPLPDVPNQLQQLEAERTALMVNHMMRLRTSLGKDRVTNLETYFAKEITPHVSLKQLAHSLGN